MKHGATKATQDKVIDGARDTAQIVVIGYGNTLLRDDGAGIALAEKLVDYWLARGLSARLLTGTQLLPEMAAEIAADGVEAVVFIDSLTAMGGGQTTAPNSCPSIQIAEVEMDSTSPSMGHHLGPSTLLIYAATLYGCRPPAWLVTIPCVDFDHGQGFSPEVMNWLTAVPTVATRLLAEIKERIPCMN
jgi:hydrogenase maturation protease